MRAVLLLVAFLAAAAVPPAVRGQPAGDLAGHWAEERIGLLIQRGIVSAAGGPFRPDDPVTRADFIRWLVAASGVSLRPVLASPFIDVPAYHPAAVQITAALAQGWLTRAPLFRPEAPQPRGDAVVTAVRALGYAPEGALLAGTPLPFTDAATLPAPIRGAVALALLTEPRLLIEPSRDAFDAEAPLSRAEAASLAAGLLLAGERGITLRAAMGVGPGIELRIEKRGVLRVASLWRIQIAAFVAEANAQRLAGQIRARGLPAVVELEDGLYKVRVGSFVTPGEAEQTRGQLAAEGFSTWLVQSLPSLEALPGPVRSSALFIDPAGGLRLKPAMGDGLRLQRARPSEMARRTSALAAINGGFFSPAGDPLGCLIIDGEIVSEPDPQRTCAGIASDGSLLFDLVRADLAAVAADGVQPISAVNRERRADELVLYRPAFGERTRTNAFGAEAVVTGGVVTAVMDLRGNAPIPPDGFVLSGHGRGRQWILQTLRPGTAVALQTTLSAASGDPRWSTIRDAIGGGPRLLAAGQFAAAQFTGFEGFTAGLTDRRHPRSAVGVLPDGRILLFVADGRRPSHSLGMTLLELAAALRGLGAVEAMNLDGGGSSVLIVGGQAVTVPSEETGERAVPDALLVLPAPQTTP